MTRRTLWLDETPDGKGRFHWEHVDAEIAPDGSIVICGVLQGDAVEEWFGDWDHEFGLTIPAKDVSAALVAVLADVFASPERMTVERLRTVLKDAGIEVSSWTWT